MKITHVNLISVIQEGVVELSLILSSFEAIEQDTPATHTEIELLNGRFAEAIGSINDAIVFIAAAKPQPGLVSDRLKSSLQLMTQILNEKTRILKATPPPPAFDINKVISLN